MDCQTTLEFLDCVRPGSDDLSLPEMSGARSHLETCETCRAEFERRQEFDAFVFETISAVRIPETLLPNLLAAVNQIGTASQIGTADGESPTESSADSRSQSEAATTSIEALIEVPGQVAELVNAEVSVARRRRAFVWKLAASVACMVVIAAVWMLGPAPRTFDVAELLRTTPLNLEATEAFDQSFDAQLPSSWSSNHHLRVLADWRGVELDGKPTHEGAMAWFRFQSRRGTSIGGLIVVLPAERVSPLPAAGSLPEAHVEYFKLESPAHPEKLHVATAWQEGGHVYVCFLLNGNSADMDELQHSLRRSAA